MEEEMKRDKAGCVGWCAILSLIVIPIPHPWRIRKDNNAARPFPGLFSDQNQFQSQPQHARRDLLGTLLFQLQKRSLPAPLEHHSGLEKW